ncbi:MAG: membrane protein insertion efficiency factor YidD [Candidatus Parcubacteria bacterium]|nr:membrane protein insertion efficiency factor YidD [Candidatus Parcubacteria bacterium]
MKLKKYFIGLISFYQKYISILKKQKSCVFYPTCSEYMKIAIEKYGIFKGLWLGLRRIFRCHPWKKNHIDPVK